MRNFKQLIALLSVVTMLAGCSKSVDSKAVDFLKERTGEHFIVVNDDKDVGIVELSSPNLDQNVFVHVSGDDQLTNYYGVLFSREYEAKVTAILNEFFGTYTVTSATYSNYFDDCSTTYTLEDYMRLATEAAHVTISVDSGLRTSWDTLALDVALPFIRDKVSINLTVNVSDGQTIKLKVDGDTGVITW